MIDIQMSRKYLKLIKLEERLKRKPPKKKSKPRERSPRPQKAKSFRNTPLGRFLYQNCPVEWKLITESIKFDKVRYKADFIENVCLSSGNPIFNSPEFRKVLGDFRKYKMCTPNQKEYTVEDELEAIRKRTGIE